MFEKIGKFSVKYKWLIVILWLILAVSFKMFLPGLSTVRQKNSHIFLPANSPSKLAVQAESNFQPKGSAGNGTIVFTASQKLTAPDIRSIDNSLSKLKQVNGVITAKPIGISKNHRAYEAIVYFNQQAIGNTQAQLINNSRNALSTSLPKSIHSYLTGSIADQVDSSSNFGNGASKTTIYSALFIIILLIIVFRSLLAPLITLIPAVIALFIGEAVVTQSSHIGVQISFVTQLLLIVLILGAGTDYGLFLIFRVRELVRKGYSVNEAIVEGLKRVGESITFSALTVIAALMALLFATFGLYHGLGPALAIGLAIMLVVSLTLTPALLAIFGRQTFWPSKLKNVAGNIGLWGRIADKAIARPKTVIVLGIVLFIGLAAGITGYKTAGYNNGQLPKKSQSAIGDRILAKNFGKGSSNTALAIFEYKKSVFTDGQILADAASIQNSLSTSNQFKAVKAPFSTSLGEQLVAAQTTQNNNTRLNRESKLFISKSGNYIQMAISPSAGPPGSTQLANATPVIRNEIMLAGKQFGAEKTYYFSDDAFSYDISHTANHDLKKIIPIVLFLIAIILAILLRSMVAPWYLIITVGLSYLAALGFTMDVFVRLFNQDGIDFVVAFMLFIFSMALGEDYNILVMTRIKEEASKTSDLNKAIRTAIGVTGSTITSAGLILAGTFAVVGLVGGSRQVEQIGYSIAFGILLDTFFVRTLLLPSIVSIFGDLNWWPWPIKKKQ